MDDTFILENRSTPNDAALLEAARSMPNGYVYELDWDYREDEYIPTEAIRGGWKVDANGKLTGEYGVNPNYREVMESVQRTLKPYLHDVAKQNPDEWLAEVDEAAEQLFPQIPPESIIGWWYVDEDGVITDAFRPSATYAKKLN